MYNTPKEANKMAQNYIGINIHATTKEFEEFLDNLAKEANKMNGAIEQVARFMGNGVSLIVACLTVRDFYPNINLQELVEACNSKGMK
jgi:hypothetical protein